ncbi:MAG: hypothetical protein AAGG07_01870 [Planctomycetota bacterium]
MNIPSKTSSLQAYQTILYHRALHPELFQLRAREVHAHGRYELETWLTEGGHVLRFTRGSTTATELLTDREEGLPDVGVVTAGLCGGERDVEHEFDEDGVRYISTVQTETLSENLYRVTLDEMREHASDADAVSWEWMDDMGPCMSMLDVQRFAREVHVQAYHLIASGGIVIRSQTIFEHR